MEVTKGLQHFAWQKGLAYRSRHVVVKVNHISTPPTTPAATIPVLYNSPVLI